MIKTGRILIRGASQLLTLRGHDGARRGAALAEIGLIADGAVLVHNGVIEEVGSSRRIENMAHAREAREVDATGRVVMPAFIDCHACICPVAAAPGVTNEFAKASRTGSASRLEAQSDRLLKIIARHGTATIAAVSGYGATAAAELKILRVLNALKSLPLDIVPVINQLGPTSPDLLAIASHRKLADFFSVRCGEGSLSSSAASTRMAEAKALGFQVRLEGQVPHEATLVELAVRLKASSISNIHIRRVSEIEALANSSTFTIHMPARAESELTGGGTRELVDSGALIALATGLNPKSRSSASMFAAIDSAVEALSMTAAEAISAATINAAWAIGQGTQTGSLEPGKRADIIMLSVSDYRDIVQLRGTNLTHTMIKRGVILFEEEFSGWPARP